MKPPPRPRAACAGHLYNAGVPPSQNGLGGGRAQGRLPAGARVLQGLGRGPPERAGMEIDASREYAAAANSGRTRWEVTGQGGFAGLRVVLQKGAVVRAESDALILAALRSRSLNFCMRW